MSGEELQALQAELGARAPDGLTRLSAAELRDLLEVVTEARRRQAMELQAAGERAFGHIPRLLRAPIRKITGA